MDEFTTVAYLRRLVDKFCDERDWHETPKDLAMSMSIEVGELMEHFRFQSDKEITLRLQDLSERQDVAHELADVLYHILALSSALDIDLSAVFRDKMALTATRYPANITQIPASKSA